MRFALSCPCSAIASITNACSYLAFNITGLNLLVRCKFNCWYEEWEEQGQKNNDPVVWERFIQKYKDLVWIDPDVEEGEEVGDVKYQFYRMDYLTRKGGWHVGVVRVDEYDPNDPEVMVEHWLPDVVVQCIWFQETGKDDNGDIMPGVKQNPELGVHVVMQEDDAGSQAEADTDEEMEDN